MLGSLIATQPANPFAQLFTKQMEIEKIQALKDNHFDYEGTIIVSQEVKRDLTWWEQNLQTIYAHIQPTDPQHTIHTDASTHGYGFWEKSKNIKAGQRWALEEQTYHINVLEIIAILYALQSVYQHYEHTHIRIMTDNTTAMAAINNQGSTKSPQCNKFAREIWDWAIKRNIWLSAAHIPGIDNVEADEASREFKDQLEWTIQHEHFQRITEIFGIPQIDLFASRLNHKTEIYCSYRPDPHAHAIDAFTIKWDFPLAYAFPPFCMVGKMLQKIVRDKTLAIIIVPNWPTKPWYPIVHNLAIQTPIILQVTDDMLFLPHRSTHKPHPMSNSLTLLVAKVCGNR